MNWSVLNIPVYIVLIFEMFVDYCAIQKVLYELFAQSSVMKSSDNFSLHYVFLSLDNRGFLLQVHSISHLSSYWSACGALEGDWNQFVVVFSAWY